VRCLGGVVRLRLDPYMRCRFPSCKAAIVKKWERIWGLRGFAAQFSEMWRLTSHRFVSNSCPVGARLAFVRFLVV
jgi:hypothetical protein